MPQELPNEANAVVKRRPSDAEINRQIAEMLGWTSIAESDLPDHRFFGISPTGACLYLPDWCDPEEATYTMMLQVLEAIQRENRTRNFLRDLPGVSTDGEGWCVFPEDDDLLGLLKMPPRQLCEHALKAFYRWYKDWE